MTHSHLSKFTVCLLFLQAPAWGFGSGNSSGGSGSGGGHAAVGGGSDSSSSASSSNDPPGGPEEEKKAREKRLAELAELQKKQRELEKQKREQRATEKVPEKASDRVKEKPPKPKPDDEDFKIIVPQRVRNEAVSWLAGGGVAPPSLLLRATMQTLRRRLQARGEPAPALSDTAVISRLAQTL